MKHPRLGDHSGSYLLISVLALSTICTTYFGFRAFESSRSRRNTAEAVVRDYERIASSETVHRIDSDLEIYTFFRF